MDFRSDLFQDLNANAHDIASAVLRVRSVPRDRRVDAIRGLRLIVGQTRNTIPSVCRNDFFDAINDILRDSSSSASLLAETLWLLVDITPTLGPNSTDRYLSPLLPKTLELLNGETDPKRASLRLICVYMKFTQNLQLIFRSIIDFGINSEDLLIRKSVLTTLPLLLSEDLQNENLFPLVSALGKSLIRSETQLFYAIFLVLQRIHSLVGNSVFEQYLDSIETEAKQLYRSVLSRNPSADQPISDSLLEMSSESQRNRQKVVSFDVSNDDSLAFGVFPAAVVRLAHSERSSERLSAAQSILRTLRDASKSRLQNLQTDQFLSHLIASLLSDHNFDVTLSALDIIEVLAERFPTTLRPSLESVVFLVVRRLSDVRTVVRESAVKTLHCALLPLSPQQVLDALLDFPNAHPRIRQETAHRITAALLTCPRDLNLSRLSFRLIPLLRDPRRSVRLAALETTSALVNAFNPNRAHPLWAAIEAEERIGSEGLMSAVRARISRKQLPRVASDGTVRSVLANVETSGSDIQWVLLAENSPEIEDKNGFPLNSNQLKVDSSDALEAIGRRKSLAENNIDKLLNTGNTDSFPPILLTRGNSWSSEDEMLEWKNYFHSFRRQLADAALHSPSVETMADMGFGTFGFYDNNEDNNQTNKEHPEVTSRTPLPAVQDIVTDDFGNCSPVRSESSVSEFLNSNVFESRISPLLERSLSLPSISAENPGNETQEPEVTFKTEPEVEVPLLDANREMESTSVRPEREAEEAPLLSVEEVTPEVRVLTPESTQTETIARFDVSTQKNDDTDDDHNNQSQPIDKHPPPRRHTRRLSRSQSPLSRRRPSRLPQHLYIRTTPAIAANANIRIILSNVAKTEGAFSEPQEALRAALLALQDDAWTTKVEGMLALARLAHFHSSVLIRELHSSVNGLIRETRNPRSTVSRAAIFTLGELFVRLRGQAEPELDAMISALLARAGDAATFVREDVERALSSAIDFMPQTRTALALIQFGANHRNASIRRTSARFLSVLVDRMGATKCLLGPKDIGEHLLPSVSRFIVDSSPITRYFGRKIFAVLMIHSSFEKLLRKHVTPGTYRNIAGILESIRRRGVGDRPQDLVSDAQP